MQLWAVKLNPLLLPNNIFTAALSLLDTESQIRINRFHRHEDACRCLIGRLLPRMLLKAKGVTPASMTFGATSAGKPYIASPKLDVLLEFNISHDNGLVVMAFTNEREVGVDVMKVSTPAQFASIAESVCDQLTPLERRIVFNHGSDSANLFYWIWTLKEAYTKALGSGLGFDFRRIEYNVWANEVKVDGMRLQGWCFRKFELSVGGDTYQGVAAEIVGGSSLTFLKASNKDWIVEQQADRFVVDAIDALQ